MKRTPILRTLLIVIFLTIFMLPVLAYSGEAASGAKEETDTAEKTFRHRQKPETYGRVAISIVNFRADGVPEGSAHALGLNLKGGVRLTEVVNLEGGLNWILVPDFPLPIPLSWMPGDNGFYMNLGAGLRFNLVRYHENRTVPWISIWRVGHGVFSDFSVGGSGTSYGLGVEGQTEAGKKWQLSLTIHEFTGNLEIYDERDYSYEYRDTDIKAVELNISVSMK